MSGSKMNQFAEFENRKSQISRWFDPWIAKSAHRFIGSSIHRLITGLVLDGPITKAVTSDE